MAYIGNTPDRGVISNFKFSATASQNTFSGLDSNSTTLAYEPGSTFVFHNGVKLSSDDFTASDGSSVVLTYNASASDVIEVLSFGSFHVADAISVNQSIGSHLIPTANVTYNIGSSTSRWNTINGNNLNIANTVQSNLSPTSNSSYNLGTETKRWGTIFGQNANFSGTISAVTNLLSIDTPPLVTNITSSSTHICSTDSKIIIVEVFGASGGAGGAINSGGSSFVNGSNGGTTTAAPLINNVANTNVVAYGGTGTVTSRGDASTSYGVAHITIGTGQAVRFGGGEQGYGGANHLSATARKAADGGYSFSIFEKTKGENANVVCTIGAAGTAGSVSGGYSGRDGHGGRIFITEIF